MSERRELMERVFVVDDDPLVLNALTVVLSREGYQVTGFGRAHRFSPPRKRARRPASSSTCRCPASPGSTF